MKSLLVSSLVVVLILGVVGSFLILSSEKPDQITDVTNTPEPMVKEF